LILTALEWLELEVDDTVAVAVTGQA
jgi:hypothetical protein